MMNVLKWYKPRIFHVTVIWSIQIFYFFLYSTAWYFDAKRQLMVMLNFQIAQFFQEKTTHKFFFTICLCLRNLFLMQFWTCCFFYLCSLNKSVFIALHVWTCELWTVYPEQYSGWPMLNTRVIYSVAASIKELQSGVVPFMTSLVRHFTMALVAQQAGPFMLGDKFSKLQGTDAYVLIGNRLYSIGCVLYLLLFKEGCYLSYRVITPNLWSQDSVSVCLCSNVPIL